MFKLSILFGILLVKGVRTVPSMKNSLFRPHFHPDECIKAMHNIYHQ